MTALFIDGAPATADDLAHQALVNYGAFTSFRVEAGGVRGLDRHLARLEASALALFGEPVGEDRLRTLMRGALEGRSEAWLRVSLFSRHISHRETSWTGQPSVMVGVFDPPAPLAGPLRVQLQPYGREAPQLKHTATFGLVRARRAARAAGFDDALFMEADGRISEGSLWNIGFLKGDRVVWPQAPMLAGVAQALIQAGLADLGLASDTRSILASDLAGFDGAFICNSATPACPVAAIGDVVYAPDAARIARIAAAYAVAQLQPI